MEESRLDNELERIYGRFPFLWKDHNFHIKYLTRSYGVYHMGFIVGLENDVCKLVFEKESVSPVELIRDYIGKKAAIFRPPNDSYFAKYGWYPLTGLIYWLSGVEYKYEKDVDKDLANLSQYLKLHIDKVLELFQHPEEFDSKLEYYKNLYKDKQITVDQIKAERARLKALGQDWSVEAAIASLRGGGK